MKKLRVAICDDMTAVTSTIEKYLSEYNNCKIECEVFNDSERLVRSIKEEIYDIYFLDIEMPKVNGLKVAHLVREYDLYAFIVFITNYTNYMKDVFQVNTFDFLLKPIDKKSLYETTDRILTLLEYDDDKFSYTKRNRQVFVPMKEIIFFEKQGRYVLIRTKNNLDKFIMSTKTLLGKLDSNFLQIHTSFIINLKYLKRLIGDEVVLTFSSEETEESLNLHVSRKYRDQAKESIRNYIGGKFGA